VCVCEGVWGVVERAVCVGWHCGSFSLWMTNDMELLRVGLWINNVRIRIK
jgi:hypothetical protein